MKTLSVSLLLLLLSLSASSSAAPDCSSEADETVLGDEDNCAGYFVCRDGEAVAEDCPWGLFFNSGAELILGIYSDL